MTSPESFPELENKLGYHFNNHHLLATALTHRSATKYNNERLEFLGDSALGYVIAEYLYQHYPTLQEGKLSRLRSLLVCGGTLASIAKTLDLNQHMILGPGEIKTGGAERESILADAFEAVIGAVLLDSNLETCQTIIMACFHDTLKSLDPYEVNKDAKTLLQEWLQANKLPLPIYRVKAWEGADHCREFTIECTIQSLDQPIECKGTSRRSAEQMAAKKALTILKQTHTQL